MFGTRYYGARYYGPRYFGTVGAAGPPPPVPPPDVTTYALYIEGVPRNPLKGWEVDAIINGQTSFRFDILSQQEEAVVAFGRRYFSSRYFPARYFPARFFGGLSMTTSGELYRPAADEEVKLYENDNLIFGGLITVPRETGILGEASRTVKTSVTALDWKILTKHRYVNETIPAGTLKQALVRILAYLPGIILDPAQADGPMLNEQVYDYVLAEEVLNGWTTLTGYVWDISYDGLLRAILPGSRPAPYDAVDGNGVVIGDIQVEEMRDKYANRVIAKAGALTSVHNVASEQAVKPIKEVLITAPDTTDQVGLDALAASYAARAIVVPKKIRYVSDKKGLAPGQTQIVQSAKRNLNSTFMIVEVKTRMIEGQVVRREIIALEGSTYHADWRSIYRQWSGGGTPIAGGGTGGGGGTGARRLTYPLAMNDTQAVRTSAPGWIDAPGAIHVRLDTVERGTTDATIFARLRVVDAGNVVQARLWDVSISAPVPGVSPTWSGTDWSPLISWNATLNAGAHVYKLQLLSSVVDSDVMSTAYLE